MAGTRPLLRIGGGTKAQSVWLCRGGRASGGGLARTPACSLRILPPQGSVLSSLRQVSGPVRIHIAHAWHVRSTAPRVRVRWLLSAQGRSDSRSRDTPATCSITSRAQCSEAHPVSCAYSIPCPACCAVHVCELCFRNSARYVQFCSALAGFAVARWSHCMLRVRVA